MWSVRRSCRMQASLSWWAVLVSAALHSSNRRNLFLWVFEDSVKEHVKKNFYLNFEFLTNEFLKNVFSINFPAPNMFLLLATKNSISRLIPDVDTLPDVPLPVHGLKNVKSIEYDPIYQVLYWVCMCVGFHFFFKFCIFLSFTKY